MNHINQHLFTLHTDPEWKLEDDLRNNLEPSSSQYGTYQADVPSLTDNPPYIHKDRRTVPPKNKRRDNKLTRRKILAYRNWDD